jgi:hypothetical protein
MVKKLLQDKIVLEKSYELQPGTSAELKEIRRHELIAAFHSHVSGTSNQELRTMNFPASHFPLTIYLCTL